MAYDYYLHRGWDSPIDYLDDLGLPYKVNKAKAMYAKARGYVVTKVPKNSSMEAVILQAVINRGAHPSSYFAEKAMKSHCNRTLTMKKIEGDDGR